MTRQHGRLFRQQREGVPVDFTAHSATVGHDPAYFELHDLSEPLQDDELVTLRAEDGRNYTCRAIDHTNVCAIIAQPDGA